MNRWRWLLAGLLLPALLAAAPAPVSRIPLGAGVSVAVHADGTVVLDRSDGNEAVPVLRLAPSPAFADSLPPRILHAAAGAAAGHRGVLQPADDDGDGRADEDPLNGRDDDGDGRVDEDFAAVSDAMTVIAPPAGPRLELYHWSHPHVSGVLGLAAPGRDVGAGAGRTHWRVSGATVWFPLALTVRSRSWLRVEDGPGAGRAAACRVARIDGDGASLWVGVLVFAGRLTGGEAPGDPLELVGEPELAAAMVAAPTPVRLAGLLREAWSVRIGASVTPGGKPLPWIVTPPPPIGTAPHLAAGVRRAGDGWDLVLTAGRGVRWLPDPSEFRLDGRVCGDPVAVSLEEPGDAPRRLAAERAGEAAVGDPVRALQYLAWQQWLTPGTTLVHHFRGDLPAEEGVLVGQWPFGGAFRIPVRPLAPAAEPSGEGERPPTLAPDLLETYPNPFRDRLFLRFRVPETVGEGFVWDDGRPPSLGPDDPIPYSTPLPRVTLKIYTISGREIATLFDQPSAPGSYQAAWNGCDPSGRPVAMGTYFCKLQVDRWSVTQRVSVIR